MFISFVDIFFFSRTSVEEASKKRRTTVEQQSKNSRTTVEQRVKKPYTHIPLLWEKVFVAEFPLFAKF